MTDTATDVLVIPSGLRRGLARFTDYLIWGIVVTFLLLCQKQIALQNLLINIATSYILYTCFEAFLISRYATTLGKKVFGIKVLSESGEKLPFMLSLKRAWLVVALGMGLFLPIVSLLLPFWHWHSLHKKKITAWDRICSSTEHLQNMTLFDKVFIFLFYGLFFLGYGLTAHYLSQMQHLQQMRPDQIFVQSYGNKIQPLLNEALSTKALGSLDSLLQSQELISSGQKIAQEYKDSYLDFKNDFQNKVNNLTDPEEKNRYQYELDEQNQRMDLFWFIQDLRLTMAQNIILFFKTLHAQYTFKNGVPEFKDPALQSEYENYMLQIKKLISPNP